MLSARFSLLLASSLLLQPAVRGWAEIEQFRSLFEAMLDQPDTSTPIDPGKFSDLLDKNLPQATDAEIESMAPIIGRCLASKRREVHTEAIAFLFAVRSRFNSAKLLEPYVDSIGTLLDGQDEVDKRVAIGLLGGAQLKPSPKEVAVLAAHFKDERNSPEQFGMIGSCLILAAQGDPAVIHQVLEAVRRRPPDHLVEEIFIHDFGLMRTTDEEALEFIRAGFQSPSLLRGSIQAVGWLPKEARGRFQTELQRAAEDPDETPETRSAARHVLLQP